jgi:hypothetical protein
MIEGRACVMSDFYPEWHTHTSILPGQPAPTPESTRSIVRLSAALTSSFALAVLILLDLQLYELASFWLGRLDPDQVLILPP